MATWTKYRAKLADGYTEGRDLPKLRAAVGTQIPVVEVEVTETERRVAIEASPVPRTREEISVTEVEKGPV